MISVVFINLYKFFRYRKHPLRICRREGYHFAIELKRIQSGIVCQVKEERKLLQKNSQLEFDSTITETLIN